MFFLDPTYLLLIPALILSLWASSRVNSTFKKYSRQPSRNGITGAQAARRVLDSHGLYDVQIEYVRGNLTDHYDPTAKVLRLSENVYGNVSAAAIGVACHEAGHAIQHAEAYTPLKLRQAIIPITNIGSRCGIYLFMIGFIIAGIAGSGSILGMGLAWAGIALFSFTALFQLLTLPTEFDASSRALNEIERAGILQYDEIPAAKKVLNAAALTYVAALAVSLTQLLRLVLILGNLSNRRR
ncbi:MAG: zinc metallopeptidase [Clostridia bacterium]|nr:zinc metallopeptidase [Clostridia bacterium]